MSPASAESSLPSADPLDALDQLAREAAAAIQQAGSLAALEEQRIAWLGRPSHSRARALPSPTRRRRIPGIGRKSRLYQ